MAGSGQAPLRRRDDVILEVEDLTVEFPLSRAEVVHAVSGVSFDKLRVFSSGAENEGASFLSFDSVAVEATGPGTVHCTSNNTSLGAPSQIPASATSCSVSVNDSDCQNFMDAPLDAAGRQTADSRFSM